ncbi:MAG TPA: HAD-IC family P-type ATPase [Ktedonobacterales bacterium]
MSVAADADPHTTVVVHSIRGRLRLHLPSWTGAEPRRVTQRLRALPGVTRAEANALTRNALLVFDPDATTEADLLDQLRLLQPEFATYREHEPETPPAAVRRTGNNVRARIAVRGMDRDPLIAQQVVDRLRSLPGVRATASALTGRVLVEFSREVADLDDIIAEIADVELPPEPGEDHPADPLDPGPVLQSAVRTIGAALGLGLIGLQQAPGIQRPLVDPEIPATVAGVISILRGLPLIRNGSRRLLGRNTADLLFGIPNVAAMALSGSALGLTVSGLESTRLWTEAHARQEAWRRYADQLDGAIDHTPGAVIRLNSGERTPRGARVVEGYGTATGRSSVLLPAAPGAHVPAGARLFGGPFVLELEADKPFAPQTRPAPLRPGAYDRYVSVVSPLSLAYAGLTALVTRSVIRTLAALLLVSPRTALIGAEAADLDAAARVLRAGVTIVRTRRDRRIRKPDVILLDGPRLLTSRYEVANVRRIVSDQETNDLLAIAGGISTAAGLPWGGAFRSIRGAEAQKGRFDGDTATAEIDGVAYQLGTVQDWSQTPEAAPFRQRGDISLALRREGEARPLALIALRPRIADGVNELVDLCRRARIELIMAPGGDALAAHGVARRAGVTALDHDDIISAIRSRQARGDYVAFVSDGSHAGAAFDACDLAIGLTDGHSPLAARADLVAFDLGAVAAIAQAGIERERAVRDAVGFSITTNVFGAIWGFRGQPGIARASQAFNVSTLATLADGWLRLRGGDRPHAALATLVDPHPERWGERSVDDAVRALGTTPQGLTSAEATQRQRSFAPHMRGQSLLGAISEQLRSPMTAILGVGAGISLLLGAPADVAIIGATIAANIAVGAWQERSANQVAQALERLSAAHARVLRDGQPETVPASAVVPGDVLLLGPGERVTADARLLDAQGLEVDEAALTGESLPVFKSPDGGSAASRVLLDGSDVLSGSGRALAVAVGRNTRLGAITASLSATDSTQSQLNVRLGQLIGRMAPLAIGGGAVVFASGFLRTRALLPQIAMAATIAMAAAPEGLPLLTQVSEAGVARRLAERHAIVRRLPAVEALGRVDVVCTDKTGTLTQGKLALRLLADAGEECALPSKRIPAQLLEVLLSAALASPHADAPDATSHPTDIAVLQAAEEAGLGQRMREERQAESPFDPMRAFHAARVDERLHVKGAPEVVIPRCARLRTGDLESSMDDAARERLLQRARAYAEQGLRVLVVAEGPAESAPENPTDLTAVGFLGIKDPLREAVRAAVRRCHEAGVRVLMLTGDHPATAVAIASEAGLLDGGQDVAQDGALLTGAEIAELHNGELESRLERAAVIARATPLDKLRIVESLQRRGHTVAMTGDGVNDAPALRLADIGVAMGRGGAEIARQTADVIIADDNFATLVETFVEGRSFWRNIRRAIGLLLGGNIGELGLVVGATGVGLMSPLTARQALIVNAITDILPGLAIGLQQPETRHLAGLARESASALDRPLWNDVARRGVFTGGPSLAGFVTALALGGLPQARTVAYTSVIGAQLAQTLDMGWSEGTLTGPVLAAVAGSVGALGLTLTIPAARTFLGLALPTPLSWGLIGGATLTALALSRMASAPRLATPQPPPALPAAGESSASRIE